LRAVHAGMPTVATVTSRAAWGAGVVSLRAGVGFGVSAGRRLALGVDGGRVVKEEERERGFGQG
jgi:hypothetical protein